MDALFSDAGDDEVRFKVRAKKKFDKKDEANLNFKKGALIDVIDVDEADGTFFGRLACEDATTAGIDIAESPEGWFPQSYVVKLTEKELKELQKKSETQGPNGTKDKENQESQEATPVIRFTEDSGTITTTTTKRPDEVIPNGGQEQAEERRANVSKEGQGRIRSEILVPNKQPESSLWSKIDIKRPLSASPKSNVFLSRPLLSSSREEGLNDKQQQQQPRHVSMALKVDKIDERQPTSASEESDSEAEKQNGERLKESIGEATDPADEEKVKKKGWRSSFIGEKAGREKHKIKKEGSGEQEPEGRKSWERDHENRTSFDLKRDEKDGDKGKEEKCKKKGEEKDAKVKDIAKEGWLVKKGYIHKAWKKRYFILTRDATLEYYKNSDEKSLIGVIFLDSECRCEQIEWQNHTYTFCLHRPERTRVFYLKAESEKEMKDWIHAVDKVIKGTTKNKSDGMKKKRDSSTFVKKNPLKKSQGAQKELQKKDSM